MTWAYQSAILHPTDQQGRDPGRSSHVEIRETTLEGIPTVGLPMAAPIPAGMFATHKIVGEFATASGSINTASAGTGELGPVAAGGG